MVTPDLTHISNVRSLALKLKAIDKKRFLPIAIGALTFLGSAASAGKTKPNVLILVTDDQGWGDVGYHGGEMSTPNIDQLAKDGLEMNRWYSYPVCSPTRVSLLTGHISMRHKVFSPIPANLTIPHDEQLMNQAFKEAGYMTMTAGKWHLGMTHVRDLPINRGFDHTYGSLRAGPDYWAHGRGEQKDWARDGETVFESGYMTDLFGNEISRLIRERDPAKPFFPTWRSRLLIIRCKHLKSMSTNTLTLRTRIDASIVPWSRSWMWRLAIS